jgi:hypothetical protein
MKLPLASLLAIVYSVFSSGCATPVRFEVRIDSISSGQIGKTKYTLLPGKEGVSSGDLQFQEFATYAHRALEQKGFIEVTNLDNADIAIFLYYSISKPSEHQYSYSTPIYGQTGVSEEEVNRLRGQLTAAYDGGVASVFKTVQGLSKKDIDYLSKRELLSKLFESNLKLRAELA